MHCLVNKRKKSFTKPICDDRKDLAWQKSATMVSNCKSQMHRIKNDEINYLPSPNRAVHIEIKTMRNVSDHIVKIFGANSFSYGTSPYPSNHFGVLETIQKT